MHWTVHSIRTKTKERDKKGEKYREIDMKKREIEEEQKRDTYKSERELKRSR